MAERQTVAQVQQIGKETVSGTGVAATKRLGSVNFNIGPNADAQMFRPRGLKFASVQALNREWTEGDMDGQPTYDEMVYPLAMCVGAPTTSQLMDGATATGAYQHVFSPASAGPDTPLSFTLEQGDTTVQAEKVAGLIATAVGLSVSRTAVALSGSLLARAISKAITMTTGLTTPAALVPILPGQFSVFTAASAALLGTTQQQLTRVVSINPSLGDKYNPAWFVNASDPSYSAVVENADGPTAENAMTLEADAAGMGFLDRVRDGASTFMRLEAIGPMIYDGASTDIFYRFCWDMCLKARELDSWSDEDGIYAIPFTFQMAHDATWGKSQQITVVNKLAAL